MRAYGDSGDTLEGWAWRGGIFEYNGAEMCIYVYLTKDSDQGLLYTYSIYN